MSSVCTNTFADAHGRWPVGSVRFARNDKYILSSGADSTCRLWDLRAGRELVCYEGARQKDCLFSAAFTHTEDYVLSPDEALHGIVCWDARTGTRLGSFDTHTAPVRRVVHAPGAPCFVSCSWDRRLAFWCVDDTNTDTAAVSSTEPMATGADA